MITNLNRLKYRQNFFQKSLLLRYDKRVLNCYDTEQNDKIFYIFEYFFIIKRKNRFLLYEFSYPIYIYIKCM